MHPYSTDATRPIRVMLFLAALSIILAYFFDRSLTALHLRPPWWLDTPAVLGFYGLCWRFYDEYLWRTGWVTRTLSGVPNLNGHWTGTIYSSHPDQGPVEAALVIRQSSSRILITLESNTSKSYSTMASLCSAPGPNSGLRYAFSNVPRPLAKKTMGPHSGLAQLALSGDGSQLSGDYETDRFRATNGRLEFRRSAATVSSGGNETWEKPSAHT